MSGVHPADVNDDIRNHEHVLNALKEAIAHAAHVLPDQGPIGVFIHHNTLHAFQNEPFDHALAHAKAMLDVECYLLEDDYRAELARGRITEDELRHAFDARWNESASDDDGHALSAKAVRWAMLRYGLPDFPPQRIRWEVSERHAALRLRADISKEQRQHMAQRTREWLWQVREDEPAVVRVIDLVGVRDLRQLRDAWSRGQEEAIIAASLWCTCTSLDFPVLPLPGADIVRRTGYQYTLRDLLRVATGEDVCELINPVMMRFCAAYLDEGVAHWTMPEREKGMWHAFVTLESTGFIPRRSWLRGLSEDVQEIKAKGTSPSDVALTILKELGVEPSAYKTYIARVLLELPGWAGMIARLERHPLDRALNAPAVSLLDYLAIRLLVRRRALEDVARRRLAYRGPLSGLKAFIMQRLNDMTKDREHIEDNALLSAWRIYNLAQLNGLACLDLLGLTKERIAQVLDVVRSFHDLPLRATFQNAYEIHHRDETMAAIKANLARPLKKRTVNNPRFQIFCCIDDREEGFRRHFEEFSSHNETFGVAGFFGFAIEYQGLDDSASAPLCPVVVSPTHRVDERAHPDDERLARKRVRRKKLAARLQSFIRWSTRSLMLGLVLTPVFGVFGLFNLALRVLSPRLALTLRRAFGERFLPRPRTELRTFSQDAIGHAMYDALSTAMAQEIPGFTASEKADRVQVQLENIGLRSRFANIIAVFGHGATSQNNPHQSAYDCGACGGRNGYACARLFAEAANDSRVRAVLRERGIDIPEHTWFIGGLHDTTTDDLTLADRHLVPQGLREALRELEKALKYACMMSAHERCRRFESAPRTLSARAALRHVGGRAHDLGEPRPELGHANNAITLIGPRTLTRGLFLDRRALLISYEPSCDETGAALARIMGAVVPVCAGINLEYYFSRVDNTTLGAGTKLPHNLVALLGVMDGTEGDLRTGLPKQMIEIHEPLRSLTVIYANPDQVFSIIKANQELESFFCNHWVRLVCIDPCDQSMHLFKGSTFTSYEPPAKQFQVVGSSRAYYAGHLDGLPPALIDSELALTAPTSTTPKMQQANTVDEQTHAA